MLKYFIITALSHYMNDFEGLCHTRLWWHRQLLRDAML